MQERRLAALEAAVLGKDAGSSSNSGGGARAGNGGFGADLGKQQKQQQAQLTKLAAELKILKETLGAKVGVR
jgi:hypothetical protein